MSADRCSQRTVITVERSGGFAARCERCGGATFGGFERRSDARAAIGHIDVEAVSNSPLLAKS